MQIETKQPFDPAQAKQILERRKEIHPVRYSEQSNGVKQELVEMLKETKSDFTLDHVRDAIYNEEDNDDMIYPIG